MQEKWKSQKVEDTRDRTKSEEKVSEVLEKKRLANIATDRASSM